MGCYIDENGTKVMMADVTSDDERITNMINRGKENALKEEENRLYREEISAYKAEVALYKTEVELYRSEIKSLRKQGVCTLGAAVLSALVGILTALCTIYK